MRVWELAKGPWRGRHQVALQEPLRSPCRLATRSRRAAYKCSVISIAGAVEHRADRVTLDAPKILRGERETEEL